VSLPHRVLNMTAKTVILTVIAANLRRYRASWRR
jgi:hypothetical protein